jgi:hypothetical protein
VEIALRIKQLLYNEMFTIAGARKKLQSEQREGSKPKAAASPVSRPVSGSRVEAPTLFDTGFETSEPANSIDDSSFSYSGDQRDALKTIASHLLELREMLKTPRAS